MPAAARKGDSGTPHKKRPYTIAKGSPDVFINGKPAARVGDVSTSHANHVSTIVRGSSSVKVNGRPLARTGDQLSACTQIAGGSSNVFSG